MKEKRWVTRGDRRGAVYDLLKMAILNLNRLPGRMDSERFWKDLPESFWKDLFGFTALTL